MMMSLRIQFLLTALLANSVTIVVGELRGASSSGIQSSPVEQQNDQQHRQLMGNKGGGGGDFPDFANGGVLDEDHQCVGFETRVNVGSALEASFNNPNTEATCLTNTCSGGCCRLTSEYTLQCLGNGYGHLAVRQTYVTSVACFALLPFS